MSAEIAQLKKVFVEGLGNIFSRLGFGRLSGHLAALLFLSSHPLSLVEMMDELSVSKASVSISIRELERLGFARRVWKKGDRRHYYELFPGLWEKANQSNLSLMDSYVELAETALRMLPEPQDVKEVEEVEVCRKRLRELKDFYQMMGESLRRFGREWEGRKKRKSG